MQGYQAPPNLNNHMKKFFKILGILVLILIGAVIGIITYIKTTMPNVGDPEDIKIEYTAERISRGEYLANSVSVCMDCHSTRDWSKFSGPLTPGTLGKGGERFDQSVGMPGVYFSKNITPEGITRYTDGELLQIGRASCRKESRFRGSMD